MLGEEFALYLFGHPFWSFHKVKAAWDPVVEMFEKKKLTRGCLERVCARAEGDKGPCLEKVGGRTLRGEGNFLQHIVCTVGIGENEI